MRNLVLINNVTHQRETLSERPIRLSLRVLEWVVRRQHTWDWRTLDFAFFVLEWIILKSNPISVKACKHCKTKWYRHGNAKDRKWHFRWNWVVFFFFFFFLLLLFFCLFVCLFSFVLFLTDIENMMTTRYLIGKTDFFIHSAPYDCSSNLAARSSTIMHIMELPTYLYHYILNVPVKLNILNHSAGLKGAQSYNSKYRFLFYFGNLYSTCLNLNFSCISHTIWMY